MQRYRRDLWNMLSVTVNTLIFVVDQNISIEWNIIYIQSGAIVELIHHLPAEYVWESSLSIFLFVQSEITVIIKSRIIYIWSLWAQHLCVSEQNKRRVDYVWNHYYWL